MLITDLFELDDEPGLAQLLIGRLASQPDPVDGLQEEARVLFNLREKIKSSRNIKR